MLHLLASHCKLMVQILQTQLVLVYQASVVQLVKNCTLLVQNLQIMLVLIEQVLEMHLLAGFPQKQPCLCYPAAY